jgi:type II secretory pathway pseudopilin PulG
MGNREKGFSLLELLIYMALLAMILPVIAVIFLSVNSGRVSNEVRSEVNSNVRFAVDKIGVDLRAATSVSSPPSGTSSSISFVKHAYGPNSQTNTNAITTDFTPFNTSTKSGDLIVVSVLYAEETSTARVSGITDDSGNKYLKAVSGSNAGTARSAEIWYSANAAPMTNATATFTAAFSTFKTITVLDYSGGLALGLLDVTSTANYNGIGTWNSGTSTTTAANELIFGSVMGGLVNAVSPYTARSTEDSNLTEDRFVASTGAYSVQAQETSSGDHGVINMATFKAVSTGGGSVSSTLTLSTASGTISYCVTSGVLRRQAGGGTCTTSSDAITDSTVFVSTSTFTRFENTNAISGKTAVSIQIDIAMSFNGTGPDKQYSEEKITTVSPLSQ